MNIIAPSVIMLRQNTWKKVRNCRRLIAQCEKNAICVGVLWPRICGGNNTKIVKSPQISDVHTDDL